MVNISYEDVVKMNEGKGEHIIQICEFFNKKGYVRVRIRKRGLKKSKVRNLRALTSDPALAKEVKVFLKRRGINVSSYSIGKSICIDIEGKHKLEKLLKIFEFDQEKKKQIQEALKPLSLSVEQT